MIKKLKEQVTQNLCAQQVITSVQDCIKELIDNSIDGGASSITILLNQYGKKSIEVRDNGRGIESFEFLGKKGSTSKNKGVDNAFLTLGFRGEALHSLAKVSQKMFITTKYSGAPLTQFDLKTSTQTFPNQQIQTGTIVFIEGLFQYLPVRKYQLANRFREQLKSTDELIREYALIYPTIQFIFLNCRNGKDDVLIDTGKFPNTKEGWKNRIEEVIGNKIVKKLIYIESNFITGWILGNIESGSSQENTIIRKNIHYMYVNHRPIDPLPKIVDFLDSVYKKYSKSTKYVFILNLKVEKRSLDVNLTPNKRQVILDQQNVNNIINELKKFISEKIIQDIPSLQDYLEKKKQTQTKQKVIQRQVQDKPPKNEEQIKKKVFQKLEKEEKHKKKSESQATKITKGVNRRQNLIQSLNARMSLGRKTTSAFTDIKKQIKQLKEGYEQKEPQEIKSSQFVLKQKKSLDISEQFGEKKTQKIQEVRHQKQQNSSQQKKKLEERKQKKNLVLLKKGEIIEEKPKSLTKQSFRQFKIVGQFNKGFILCEYKGIIYLVDQHAASEKCNFEQLMEKNLVQVATHEVISLNSIELNSLEQSHQLLKQSGYVFSEQRNGKVLLTRIPSFLGKVYGSGYFLQLLQKQMKLKDHDQYYQAAAMKSCRSAIMVGDALRRRQMEDVVKELSKLESPWNCPHGRPTVIQIGKALEFEEQIKDNREYILD